MILLHRGARGSSADPYSVPPRRVTATVLPRSIRGICGLGNHPTLLPAGLRDGKEAVGEEHPHSGTSPKANRVCKSIILSSPFSGHERMMKREQRPSRPFACQHGLTTLGSEKPLSITAARISNLVQSSFQSSSYTALCIKRYIIQITTQRVT